MTLAGAPLAAIGQDEMPSRKPGLWEVQVSTSQGAQVMKQCTDAETDKQMQEMVGKAGETCSKAKTTRQGDTYTAETECSIGGSKIKSKAVFQGDFNSRYTGEVQSSFDPPLMGMREDRTRLTARWVGPCEAGQKPGDVILPGGMKMNMNSMPKPPAR